MGATYTRQSSSGITDGAVIEASDLNNEFDQLLAAFVASTGHTHDGTSAEGGPITKLLGTAITIGDGTSGTDIAVTFDGETADGLLTWMEDEDYFKFSDEVLMNSTEKLLFGDTGTYIHQSADGVLDLVSDTEIEINATTIDINGAVAMDGAITGATNITLSGELDAATLDISGDADIDGTLEADAITVDGTALATYIRDTVGTNMLSSNTETGIAVTYDTSNDNIDFALEAAQTVFTSITNTSLVIGRDSDNDIDFATDNNIIFRASGADQIKLVDGALAPVTDNDVDLGTASLEFKDAYFDGTVTADAFAGPLTGDVTGNVSGTAATVTTAAQSNITSLGTLTTLTVDNVIVNGTTIGHTDDTDLITLADGIATVAGEVSVTTLDIGGTNISATAAEINLIDGGTARGTTAVADADGILHNDGGTMRMTSAATFKTYFTSGVSSAADDLTAGDSAVNLTTSSGDITIDAAANDSDIIFKGTDNSSDITMLTLDGSEAGAATFNNKIIATELDISGDVDVDGTLETDALTIGGVTLAETIADTVGAMVSSNTETGITVTYEDGDNTLDFALGAAQTTITSLLATDIKIGEDDETKVDFETANEIHFYAANAEQVYVSDGVLGPQTDNDVDLGTSGAEYKNLYIDGVAYLDAIGFGTTAMTLPTADGSADQILVTNGSGTIAWADNSGGTSWQAIKTSNFTAVAGEGYFCNTTSSAFTATLPSSPSLGDEVTLTDYAGTFDTNNLTVGRNSQPIMGEAADLTVAVERSAFTLVYVDSTQGWLLKDK